jgi:hypothetical protein
MTEPSQLINTNVASTTNLPHVHNNTPSPTKNDNSLVVLLDDNTNTTTATTTANTYINATNSNVNSSTATPVDSSSASPSLSTSGSNPASHSKKAVKRGQPPKEKDEQHASTPSPHSGPVGSPRVTSMSQPILLPSQSSEPGLEVQGASPSRPSSSPMQAPQRPTSRQHLQAVQPTPHNTGNTPPNTQSGPVVSD